MPMVSVIVPIYKVEEYLCPCVDSVLNQTYTDFELILVDDGSPDGSGAICDDYARQDGRIRVIHKKNGGLSDARNAGLDIAQGKYILFLDSDDLIRPSLLETMIPYMEKGHELAVFTYQYYYDDGSVEKPWKRPQKTYCLDTARDNADFIQKVLLQSEIGWEAWSRIFVREIIETYHLRFADNRKIFAEDLYFSLCYCAHVHRIVSVDECLHYYRQRRDSIMGQQAGKNNIARIEQLIQEVRKHYLQWEDCRYLTETFDFLHFQILMNQFVFGMQFAPDPAAYRETVISSLDDWSRLQVLIRKCCADGSRLRACYSWLKRFEIRRNSAFLLGGSVAMVKCANWLVRKIRNQCERMQKITASSR